MAARPLRHALLLAVAPLAAWGQEPRVAIATAQRAADACRGQRIDSVRIHASAPSVANLERVPWVASAARAIHVTTRADVIRRFLLLEPGDACNEQRRAESERILRAQPFIADADVMAVPNDRGGVDLDVRTSDETAFVIGGAVRGRAPLLTSALLGNANLAGDGIYAASSWRFGDGFRDGFGGRIVDHQFMRQTITMALEGHRDPIGGSWRAEAAHPYFTDLQQTAWRVRGGTQVDYLELRRTDGTRPLVTLARQFHDVGAIIRVVLPGYLGLAGVSFTGERSVPGTRLVTADTGVITDVGPLPGAFAPHRVGRVNALLGIRGLRFVRIDGLDALTAAQDVATGFQIGTQFGIGSRTLGASEPDLSLAGDFYAGATNGRSTLRLQLQGEGRRTSGASWDDVLTTGRVVHHLLVPPVQVNQASIEWSGAYRERNPFQLLLSTPFGGVRGYEESSYAGGQRIVARAEHRYAFPDVRRLGDLGVAVFGDVGKQWAGDVPFGESTGIKAAAGISLLAAVPSRSARLWRADLAVPTSSGAGARWTVRFSNIDRTTFEYRTPRDVADGRALTVPTSLFAWP